MSGITQFKEFSAEALQGLVDESVRDRTNTLGDRFLPNRNVYSNNFAYDIIKKSKYIGAMIGYGAEPPVVDRDAVAKMHGEIAKMGLKHIVTEEELLQLNQPRSNAELANLIDSQLVQGVELTNALQRRIDVIKMEALAKGSFSYNKNNVKVSVNFLENAPADHKVALTAGNDWDTADHDVIGDLLAWVDTYEKNTGRTPDVILMSREVQAKLLKNGVIVAEARPNVAGASRVSVQELTEVLNGYGLPPVQVVTDRKVTVKNVYTGADEVIEYFPVNRVVMLSEGVGNFLFGPTVENNFQPGIVLQAKDKDEPIQSILRTVAAGFPALEAPDLIFHADVFTV